MADQASETSRSKRAAAITRLAEQFAKALTTATPPNVEAVCRKYQHLMPELEPELRAAERVHRAQEAARVQPLPNLSAPSIDESKQEALHKVFGEFDLIEYLGGGGFGNVWRAIHKATKRVVAIKILANRETDRPEILQRFHREAKIGRQLKHPNIVPVLGSGQWQKQHFLVMQCVDGLNLHRYTRAKPLPSQQAAQIIRDIAKACQYAHYHAVIHRDIKPNNILIESTSGNPMLVDFGLAHEVTAEQLTGSLDQLGTLKYMAPEQADRRLGVVAAAADIYAVGATLYFLLIGKPPFPRDDGSDGKSLIHEIVWDSPPPLPGEIPKDLRTICYKCLQKTPGDRYPTAAVLADDLERYLNGKPIKTRLPGALWRSFRFCQRRPPFAAAIAALLLTAVIGTWLSVTYARSASKSEGRVQELAIENKKADQQAQLRTVEAKEAKEETLYHDYAADMQAVQKAWIDGKPEKVKEILARQSARDSDGTDPRGFEWHYWQHLLTDTSERILHNSESCRALAVNKDRKLLAACGCRAVTLWDLETGRLRQEWKFANRQSKFQPHQHQPFDHSIAFSPHGDMIAATACTTQPEPKGCLHVWDVAKGEKLLSITDDPEIGGRAVAFSPRGTHVLAGGFGLSWKAWELATKSESSKSQRAQLLNARRTAQTRGKTVKAAPGAAVTYLASTNQNVFVTGTTAGEAYKWPSGEPASSANLWDGHLPGGVLTLSNSNPVAAFTIDRQHTIHILRPEGGTKRTPLGVRPWNPPPPSPDADVVINPPERAYCIDYANGNLVAGGLDSLVYRWRFTPDNPHLPEPTIYRGHAKTIAAVLGLADGRIVSADSDGEIRVWSNNDPELVTLPDSEITPAVPLPPRLYSIVGHNQIEVVCPRTQRVLLRFSVTNPPEDSKQATGPIASESLDRRLTSLVDTWKKSHSP